MSLYSRESYTQMLDHLLSEELCFSSEAATESNIKRGMKKVLGGLIKQGILKGYTSLVLSEELNVHVTIIDQSGTVFDLILYYGA
jgi:hypothetical protein